VFTLQECGPPTSAHDTTCCAPVQAFSGFLSAVFGLRVLQGDATAAGTDPVLSSFRRGAQTAAEQPALHSPLGLLLGNALMEEENPSFLQNAAELHAPSLDMLREQLRPVSPSGRRRPASAYAAKTSMQFATDARFQESDRLHRRHIEQLEPLKQRRLIQVQQHCSSSSSCLATPEQPDTAPGAGRCIRALLAHPARVQQQARSAILQVTFVPQVPS